MRLNRVLPTLPLLLMVFIAEAVVPEYVAGQLEVCNETDELVFIAVAAPDGRVPDPDRWLMRGYLPMSPGSCGAVHPGPLMHRHYYLLGLGADGGVWAGEHAFCAASSENFLFIGPRDVDCNTEGLVRTGYLQIDVGETSSWTVELGDEGRYRPK